MKIAVITGASSGMGREFVKQVWRKEKFDEIWVIARRKEALESLKKEVKVKIRPISLDLKNPESFEIYKKLNQEREESLSNKLADGKQNPVGVIAMLNRHYGWSSPYTSDANRNRSSLTAAELPKLNGGKVLEITQESP